MRPEASEMRDIVGQELNRVADVTVEDNVTSSIIHVKEKGADFSTSHEFMHVAGYSSLARNWAQGIRKVLLAPHGAGKYREITIGLEGPASELDKLLFDVFDQGVLKVGSEQVAPGGTKIIIRSMPLRKGLGLALVEIGVEMSRDVAIPLFVAWLYDKLKNSGAKTVTVRVRRRSLEFEKDQLIKAIEEEIEEEIRQ